MTRSKASIITGKPYDSTKADRQRLYYVEHPEARQRVAAHLAKVRPTDPTRTGPRPNQAVSIKHKYETDPEYRELVVAQLLSVRQTDEAHSVSIGEWSRNYWANKANRDAAAGIRRAYWNDVEFGPIRRNNLAEMNAQYLSQWPNAPTDIENILYGLLDSAGVDYCQQYRIGRCTVDAYLYSSRTVIEADGAYWHQDQEKETNRDSYLISKGVTSVVHLQEHLLKELETTGGVRWLQ